MEKGKEVIDGDGENDNGKGNGGHKGNGNIRVRVIGVQEEKEDLSVSSWRVGNKVNGLFHTARLQSVTIGMVTKGKFQLNVSTLMSEDEDDDENINHSNFPSPEPPSRTPKSPTKAKNLVSRLLGLGLHGPDTKTTELLLNSPSIFPPTPEIPNTTATTGAESYPQRPTSALIKKVEFSLAPQQPMDTVENNSSPTATHTHIQDKDVSTDGKKKKTESHERAGSATNGHGRLRSRSPSGSLLSEIRKMSLASQDAQEEKLKKKLSSESEVQKPLKTFRRIVKRKKRREEEYTDKDRAAAVTLGSRDIKQSLKAKKKRERKMHMSLDLLTSEEFLSAMLVVEATFQMKTKKQAAAALTTLNKALELQPFHKGALVARSQCHLKLGDAASALKDAQTSFNENETYIQGLFQFAEALYQLGQFEKALIAYHQGYRLRKDMEGFRIGVQKSQEAIRRAIGDRSATQISNLEDILPLIDKMGAAAKGNEERGESRDRDSWMENEESKTKVKSAGKPNAKSNARSRWVAREVLGQMFSDKEYLLKFLQRPDIQSSNGSSTAVRDSATEALKYLEIREQFWRQQNPIYSRKTKNVPYGNVVKDFSEHCEKNSVSRKNQSIAISIRQSSVTTNKKVPN